MLNRIKCGDQSGASRLTYFRSNVIFVIVARWDWPGAARDKICNIHIIDRITFNREKTI